MYIITFFAALGMIIFALSGFTKTEVQIIDRPYIVEKLKIIKIPVYRERTVGLHEYFKGMPIPKVVKEALEHKVDNGNFILMPDGRYRYRVNYKRGEYDLYFEKGQPNPWRMAWNTERRG